MAKARIVLNWKGARVKGALLDCLEGGVARASAFVEGDVKRRISRQNPPPEYLEPSLPGEPPKARTGRLRSSITHRVARFGDRISGIVGTNVVYARRLEFGFKGTDAKGKNIAQAPRPFLRPAVRENAERIVDIIVKHCRGRF